LLRGLRSQSTGAQVGFGQQTGCHGPDLVKGEDVAYDGEPDCKNDHRESEEPRGEELTMRYGFFRHVTKFDCRIPAWSAIAPTAHGDAGDPTFHVL